MGKRTGQIATLYVVIVTSNFVDSIDAINYLTGSLFTIYRECHRDFINMYNIEIELIKLMTRKVLSNLTICTVKLAPETIN